jgi:hypothetical protein
MINIILTIKLEVGGVEGGLQNRLRAHFLRNVMVKYHFDYQFEGRCKLTSPLIIIIIIIIIKSSTINLGRMAKVISEAIPQSEEGTKNRHHHYQFPLYYSHM